MKIEIACRSEDSTKAKGDLLESLATDLLSAQSYKVIEEIQQYQQAPYSFETDTETLVFLSAPTFPTLR